jgi:hypothetical protein
MTSLVWSFVGLLVCVFLLAAVAVVYSWTKAEDSGKAKGRGEMVQECNARVNTLVAVNARLEAENTGLKAKLANVPRQYLLSASASAPALAPGTEYTRTDKWKTAPESAGKVGE